MLKNIITIAIVVVFFGGPIIGIVELILDSIRDKKIEQRNRKLEDAIKRKDKQTIENILNKNLFNNLHIDTAVEIGDTEIVSLLLTKVSDLKSIGSKLLVIAVKNNDKEMISLLIQNGANVNLKYEDKSPLDYAKDEEIITILKKYGAKTKREIDEEAEEAFIASDLFYNAKDYKKAVECLEKAVSLGHIPAHNDLALHYMQGLGVEVNYNKVYELSRVAAEAGIANSQVNLGNCYSKGKGIYQSDSNAIYWYEKAAEQGNDIAMRNLGIHYYGKRDSNNAKLWLEKAAELGNVDAMFDLGDCYRYLLFSSREAGKWYEKAARNGHVEALAALKELCGMGLYNIGDDY